MKKAILFTAVLIALLPTVESQTYDTVTGPNGRLPEYHYTQWFDTCDAYFDTLWSFILHPNWDVHGAVLQHSYIPPETWWVATHEHVDHPAAITGIGVWQVDTNTDPNYFPSQNLNLPRVPEYVHIFQGVNDTQTYVASIQWDTATPKIYKMPYNVDTAQYGFLYFMLYEAHLKNPVLVDSTFYLAGTSYNNVCTSPINPWLYDHKPTVYGYVNTETHYRCGGNHKIMGFRTTDSIWITEHSPYPIYGYFQPMIDYAMVHTLTADSTMGTAHPNCRLSKHTDQTIYATPKRGFYFIRWDDGDTTNPRTVSITQDTTFVAIFSNKETFHVSVQPNYTVRGYVTGSGTYFDGDTATITAIPNDNYRFSHWDDGDTSNPRIVVITQDTSFTAYFGWINQHEGTNAPEAQAPLFTLTPNPAHHSVTVTVNPQIPILNAYLSISDAAGRELLRTKVSTLNPLLRGAGVCYSLSFSQYPAGTYFVTLRTPDTSSTQRLVIE